jgi:multidrug efflux pump subunit AcrA (membrane-fusion protein)
MNARLWILSVCVAALGSPVMANEKNEPAQRVDLRARVTGYVMKVNFKAGDMVKKGDVLFEIDDRPYRAQLELTEAQLRAAEATVRLREAELKRAQGLFKQKAVTAQEVEKCEADREVAVANRQAAQATLKLAKLNLDFTKVQAPIDGRIGRALVTQGNLVKADDTSLAIIESAGVKPPAKDAKPSAKLLELLKERQKSLDEAASQSMKMYQNGTTTLENVLELQRAALEASLDLCDTDTDRLAVLRKLVMLAETFHRIVEAQREAGKASPVDVLQARALVLELQIRLLREEEKARAKK